MNLPEVEVSIPTKDRPEQLALTLLSVYQQTILPTYVTVHDEGLVACMENRQVRAIMEMLEEVTTLSYLRSRVQRGIVYARRKLAEDCAAPWMLWVDDDVILQTNTLEVLQKSVYNVQRPFAMPVLFDVDNIRRHSDYQMEPVDRAAHEALGESKYHVRCAERYETTIWRGNTACLLVRHDAYLETFEQGYEGVITEAEDALATLLIADKYGPGALLAGEWVWHMVNPTHQWRWTQASTNMLRVFLENRVSRETLARAGVLSQGYKVC